MNIQYLHYKSLKLDTWEEIFSQEEVNFNLLSTYLDSLQLFIEQVDKNRYCENHHVFPLCIDNNKIFTNETVVINGSDHFRAHILLSKCFTGRNRQKLCYASKRMLHNIKKDTKSPTAEEYEEERRLFIESQSGENSYLYGKKAYNDGTNIFYLDADEPPAENLNPGRLPIGNRYNNGEVERYFKDNTEIPEGFILGSLPRGKCYNNGEIDKYFKSNDEVPTEFIKGRRVSSTKDTHAYNNGKTTIYLKLNDEIPEGFKPGAIYNKIFCNNGIKDIRVPTIADIPDGYKLGSIKKDKKLKCYTDGESIKYFGENDDIPENYKHIAVARKTRGGIYYNDGTHNKLIKEGETPPENYVIGKINVGGTSGTKCYTNGVINKFIKIGDEVPEGFTLGIKR